MLMSRVSAPTVCVGSGAQIAHLRRRPVGHSHARSQLRVVGSKYLFLFHVFRHFCSLQ